MHIRYKEVGQHHNICNVDYISVDIITQITCDKKLLYFIYHCDEMFQMYNFWTDYLSALGNHLWCWTSSFNTSFCIWNFSLLLRIWTFLRVIQAFIQDSFGMSLLLIQIKLRESTIRSIFGIQTFFFKALLKSKSLIFTNTSVVLNTFWTRTTYLLEPFKIYLLFYLASSYFAQKLYGGSSISRIC